MLSHTSRTQRCLYKASHGLQQCLPRAAARALKDFSIAFPAQQCGRRKDFSIAFPAKQHGRYMDLAVPFKDFSITKQQGNMLSACH